MLSVVGVNKSFGGVHALQGASLGSEPGEIVGLIGPNGAGKSTLVNVITGFLSPDGGEVRVGDRAVTGGPQAVARAGVARTFQNIRIFKDLTVRQNVEVAYSRAVALRPDRAADVDPEALLAENGLAAVADTPAGTLPYGSQRWLEITRALATAPDVLLLDEPAAGLNDEETGRMGERLKLIRDRTRCAMVVIDHDLGFINKICDRLFVMDQGAIIAEGSPAAVWSDPRVREVYVGPSAPHNE